MKSLSIVFCSVRKGNIVLLTSFSNLPSTQSCIFHTVSIKTFIYIYISFVKLVTYFFEVRSLRRSSNALGRFTEPLVT